MTEQPKKFEPETFTLFTHDKPRAAEIDRLMMFCGDLSLDKVYTVKIRQGEETRKDVANRLYQSVMGQVAKQIKADPSKDDDNDHDPSVIAGKLKFTRLLPLKPVMAAEYGDDYLMQEWEFERKLTDMIAASPSIAGYDVWRSYDRAIRSSTLNTRPFARYLDDVITKLTIQGFVIRLKTSEKERAIGGQAASEKAA